jgi:hypothetical protein
MCARVVRLLSITLALLVVFLPAYSQSQSSSGNGKSGVVSDHDRLLLEKIDRLERRVAELEARAGIEPTKQSDPPVATATKVIQETSRPPAEMPATNSSSSSTESEDPFAFADFTWLNGNSRTKDHRWIPRSLPANFVLTSATFTTSIILRTTRSVGRVKADALVSSRCNSWVWAEIFTTAMHAVVS